MGIATDLRGRRVINARGYSTKVGGSRLTPEVTAAMTEAAGFFVRIEDIQAAAGEVIAEATGAEAGYVTAGASAGLTMAAAAVIARLDPGRMNRLPDTGDGPDEIVMLRRHRNDYDHALRVAGARLVEVGFHDWTFEYEVEGAIGSRTAALFYLGHDDGANISLETMVEIARRHEQPLIVDASMALPPAGNLRRLFELGVDLASYSGGKHIQGPQASGILAGRRDLMTSVALQHQDMDVYPTMWPARGLIDDGTVVGPPHHGLGRGFKVGKEEIAGLIAALRAYEARDFDAERARLTSYAEALVAGLAELPGLAATAIDTGATGRPGPLVEVRVDAAAAGIDATELINRLQAHDPMVCTFEAGAARGIVQLIPDALADDEVAEVVAAVDDALAGALTMAGAQVVTVRGPIEPSELGVTLSHDHILIDAFALWGTYEWILDDEAVMAAELESYKAAGGGAIADPTNIGLERQPEGLRRLSEATDVHILMGTGWYRERAYPGYIFEEMPDQLADRLVDELTVGVDGTDIRAGFIGEIGTERGSISPAQERVFRAAGRAHARTGCPILTHTTHFGELAIEQLDVLAEEGVPASDVIISHLGDRIGIHWWRDIAERGAFLNIDNLGFVSGYAPLEVRADNVAAFIAEGFIDQVMLSNDICMLGQLETYGGPGYGHVLRAFVPLLHERGITDEQIATMTIANPARAFSYDAATAREDALAR